MPIKETDAEIFFVEKLNKETIKDLLHFDEDGKDVFDLGLHPNLKLISESLTKLISSNIKACLTQYLEEVYEAEKAHLKEATEEKEKENGNKN